VKVDIPIVGDVKEVLKELIEQLQTAEHGPDTEALAQWWKHIEGWRGKNCLKFDRESEIIKPQYVVEKAWELTDGNAFVCSTSASTRCGPRSSTVSTSRVAGSTPAASARWASACRRDGRQDGAPGRRRAVHHRRRLDPDVHPGTVDLPAVRHAREDHFAEQPLSGHGAPVAGDRIHKRYSHSYMDALPDFVKLAEAYGHVGMRIERLRMWSRR
jgi:acetolactate synthase-1/2/3 large subunit